MVGEMHGHASKSRAVKGNSFEPLSLLGFEEGGGPSACL